MFEIVARSRDHHMQRGMLLENELLEAKSHVSAATAVSVGKTVAVASWLLEIDEHDIPRGVLDALEIEVLSGESIEDALRRVVNPPDRVESVVE